MSLPRKNEDRARVLTDLTTNMVVEAGAGTGKTMLLIRRIGLAILVQGVSVDKIVALTFTEKAAAEIKTRLVAALHHTIQLAQENSGELHDPKTLLGIVEQHFIREKFGSNTPKPEVLKQFLIQTHEQIQQRAQETLKKLDRASIGTIHSFCADILKTFPLQAGLSPQAEIDPGPKGTRLFTMRWNTFLESELGVNAPRKEAWKTVLSEVSLEDLKRFARKLCGGKIEHYDYFSHADKLAQICLQKSAQATAWTTAFLSSKKKAPTKRTIEKWLEWAAASLHRSACFLQRKPLPEMLIVPPKSAVAKADGWDPKDVEQARELVKFAQHIAPEKQQVFCTALSLVEDFAAQIRAEFIREGILSFDDLIVKTRALLQTNAQVRNELKKKFDVLFIDEFQDTDPVQGEILLFLAEDKSSTAHHWRDVKLAPGKLFVVGDPKQSIYRFRGADITAYEYFTDLILRQGGVKCFLRQNYRSVPDIVAVANAVCSIAIQPEKNFQPSYEPIYPVKEAQGPAVEWLFVRPPKDGANVKEFRHNQAEMIAQWIKQHVGKMTITDKDGPRKLQYKDIVLLSRAMTTSSIYTQALRRHAIAFNAGSEKDFFKHQEINDFLNLLRVLADPSDQIALVGVLRSPLGGFTDDAITEIATRNELNIFADTKDESLARCYEHIRTLLQKVGRTDVVTLLEEVLDETFLPELCAAAYDGERTLEMLRCLVQQTQTVLGGRAASLGQFLEALTKLWEEKPDALSTESGLSADAVAVMSVHKSKGLDFPVVILIDLSKQESTNPGGNKEPIYSWHYDMYGLEVGNICDANSMFLKDEQKKHERCEEARILYVALTRAKEHMILVADARDGVEKWMKSFAQAGILPDGEATTLQTPHVTVPVTYVDCQSPDDFRFYRTVQLSKPELLKALPAWRQAFDERKARYRALLADQNLSPSAQVDDETLSPQQRAAADVGTVCHRALLSLLTTPRQEITSAVTQAALSAGLPEATAQAVEILTPFCTSDMFEQLTSCKFLAGEMPFSFVNTAGRITSGVMDAVLERADGSIWVIDYKTDKIPAGGTQQLVEKYRPQLTIYLQAAKKIFPDKAVKCSAVFVRACESAEVS